MDEQAKVCNCVGGTCSCCGRECTGEQCENCPHGDKQEGDATQENTQGEATPPVE